MGNSFFRFKQFTVYQDSCAMKVGTDGVLLGAWCDVRDASSILDIGTGTGLVALMMAQRSAARIDAVEIEKEAAVQARHNIDESPWGARIETIHSDFTMYALQCQNRYDLIVSNPPYFEESLLPEQAGRTLARHGVSLSYSTLFEGAARLLNKDGRIVFIFPALQEPRMDQIASGYNLWPTRKIYIKGQPDAAPKRIITEWQHKSDLCQTEQLVIETGRHQYTEDYITLTRDFYLNM